MNIASLKRLYSPTLLILSLVGLVMGGLLIGLEPVGGDPDRLYRPLKQELARSLTQGSLPFWSDRLGLGIPLVAESHVAAFYPPNLVLYSFCSLSVAYRLAMWLHYVFLAGTSFAYARFLKLSPVAAGIVAVSFTFCGFQGIHSSHEPFYHALPYLPLSLLVAEWYLRSGRALGVILLATTWGMQLTLGHYQIQWWTAGLVLTIGLWRTAFDHRPWSRFAGLGIGLAWGAAIASVQLIPSWELANFVGATLRSFPELAFYGFPPAHWAEVAIPGFVRGIPGGPEAHYWYSQGTTGYEACFYVGTLPLVLALFSLGGSDRRLAPWRLIIAASLSLAILPLGWPACYAMVTKVPGFGWFRAPGRYVVLASLGLSLLAGRGLDGLVDGASCRNGLIRAWVFGVAAGGWVIYWAGRPEHRAVLGGTRLVLCIGLAALSWTVATGLIWAVRKGWINPWVLVIATTGELACLYYTSTTEWGWAVELPRASRMLSRLEKEPGVGRVAGLVHDLPVRAGAAPIFPFTGFAPPAPHPLFEGATNPVEAFSPAQMGRLRRYGVTHGLWEGSIPEGRVTTLLEGEDPVLDRLVYNPSGAPKQPTWKLVRYPEPFPPARAAIRVRVASQESSLVYGVSFDSDRQTVWYRESDLPTESTRPQATRARVLTLGRTYRGRRARWRMRPDHQPDLLSRLVRFSERRSCRPGRTGRDRRPGRAPGGRGLEQGEVQLSPVRSENGIADLGHGR